MKKAILFIVIVLFVSSAAYADTLIYSNSISSGYHYSPGANTEIFDFGTSPGGRVSKFSFEYVEGSTTTGPILIRFYSGTNRSTYDPGYQIKSIALSFVPGTNGSRARYEYVIPQNDRFILPGGSFGYSFEFSQSTTKLVLASGGTGQVNELWEYSDHWLYGWGFYPFTFVNAWAGLSMKIYTIPEPATMLLLGLGGLMLRRKK